MVLGNADLTGEPNVELIDIQFGARISRTSCTETDGNAASIECIEEYILLKCSVIVALKKSV